VSNVTCIFGTSPNINPEEKKWGGYGILYPPLKKWRTHVPCVPHQIAPMHAMLLFTQYVRGLTLSAVSLFSCITCQDVCVQQSHARLHSMISNKPDMCDGGRSATRVVLFVILKCHFKWTIFLTCSCHSFHNHLPQAFAFDQRFTVLQVHEQGPAASAATGVSEKITRFTKKIH